VAQESVWYGRCVGVTDCDTIKVLTAVKRFWCKLLKGLVSCDNCRDEGTDPAQDLFKGRHFDQEIIILCVRWYITFKLSFRDLV